MNKLYHNLKKTLLISGSLAILAGCSYNPTPTKFFGAPTSADITNELIHRTRCEARDAMILRAADLIETLEVPRVTEIVPVGTEPLKPISAQIRKDPSSIKSYEPWELPPLAYVIASPILRSNLGLVFTFTIEEFNDDSITPEFTSTIGSNKFTLGVVSHELDRKRKNTRSMTIGDQRFLKFLDVQCKGDGGKNGERNEIASKVNPTYPMKGNIQLNKTINTFIDFTFLDARTAPEHTRRTFAANAFTAAVRKLAPNSIAQTAANASDVGAQNAFLKANKKMQKIASDIKTGKCGDAEECKAASTCYTSVLEDASNIFIRDLYSAFNLPAKKGLSMSDTILFTTKIAGGIEPKIEYGAPSSFDLKAVALSIKPSRTDMHQVKVSMTAAIPEKQATTSAFKAFLTGTNGQTLYTKKTEKISEDGPPAECQKYADVSLTKSVRAARSSSRATTPAVPAMIGPFPNQEDSLEVQQLKSDSLRLNDFNLRTERLIDSGVTAIDQ